MSRRERGNTLAERSPDGATPSTWPRLSLTLTALAMALLTACGVASKDERSCASQSLFNGSADPGVLSLSPAEVRAIVAVESKDGTHVCTGTVIADGWVLTAAHCAVADPFFVRSPSGDASVIHYRVPHPTLDAMLLTFDADERDCGCNVCEYPIPVWDGTLGPDWLDRPVTLAGTGLTETGSVGILRFAEERVVEITPTELWVDGRGRTGACRGDSGGPAFARDARGVVRVVGVLDRGSDDCLGVDVYTRGDILEAWIVSHW